MPPLFRPVLALAALLAAPAAAQQVTAPALSAHAAFGFGNEPAIFGSAMNLPVDDFRLGIRWEDYETAQGQYGLNEKTRASLLSAIREGRAGSVTFHPVSPLYENGATVATDAGIDAFAAFVADVVRREPAIPRVEIGNEFNTVNFLEGPAKDLTMPERAALHARHLAAIRARPELAGVEILGGAAHSIAAGYLWKVLDAGGAENMDAVVVHPYTTRAELIPAQTEVLRRHPGMAGLDIEATEFGSADRADAPAYFWRNYCAMARAGYSRVVWYPLEARGDGHVPILDAAGEITPLGKAWLFAQNNAAGKPTEVFAPDDFTHGCVFGSKVAVIWGAPRSLEILRDDVAAFGPDLRPRDLPLTLDRGEVILLRAKGDAPLNLGSDIALGEQKVLADSFDQFAYPADGEVTGEETGRLIPMLVRNGAAAGLRTCPGQELSGTPWFPFLCNDAAPRFFVPPGGFALAGYDASPVSLRYSYVAETAGAVTLTADISVIRQSADGVRLHVLRDGEVLATEIVLTGLSRTFGPFEMAEGGTLEVLVDPNETVRGDAGDLRLRIERAE